MIILKPSSIEGVGCFTTKDIRAGDHVPVWESSDILYIPKGEEKEQVMMDRYCIETRSGWWCPQTFLRMSVGWYLNHSSNPNLKERDDWEYYAIKDIAVGEELTIDYRNFNESGGENVDFVPINEK